MIITINYVFAGIALADYDAALGWYKRFFGRSPDVIVTENEAMWRVTETGWIYVVGDTNRAGSALVTFLVDDLDDQIAELVERGLDSSAFATVPGLYRKVEITDPGDNVLSFGEDLSTGT